MRLSNTKSRTKFLFCNAFAFRYICIIYDAAQQYKIRNKVFVFAMHSPFTISEK